MVKVNLETQIDENYLVRDIYDQYDCDDIVDFIVKIDKMYEDWGVTKSIYERFKTIMKDYH